MESKEKGPQSAAIGCKVRQIISLITLLVTCAVISPAFAKTMGGDFADQGALENATAAMCGKSIVILGEATHGDGHSDEIKVALVERLISRCGFNMVLFEASFYEFIPILRSVKMKTPVSPELIAAAVGGLWKFDREVLPLFDFLAPQVNSGKVELGGLDFQAGGFQQPYSNDAMIAELTVDLPGERRNFCKALYHSRIYGDDAPNGMSDLDRNESLKLCLRDIGPHAHIAGQQLEVMNLEAWLGNDGNSQQEIVRSRDRMMAFNARNFIDHASKPAKVIVWTHNGHAARDTASLADYGSSDNLGSALSRHYGSDVFSMAVTARGGEYRWSRGTNKTVPSPPPDSLEALFGNADTSTFIEFRFLEHEAVSASGILNHSYIRARWGDAFDGVFVLNREHPPHSIRF